MLRRFTHFLRSILSPFVTLAAYKSFVVLQCARSPSRQLLSGCYFSLAASSEASSDLREPGLGGSSVCMCVCMNVCTYVRTHVRTCVFRCVPVVESSDRPCGHSCRRLLVSRVAHSFVSGTVERVTSESSPGESHSQPSGRLDALCPLTLPFLLGALRR